MAYKSGNPALGKNTFKNIAPSVNGQAMTLTGTAGKSLFLLFLAIPSGLLGWQLATRQYEWLLAALLGAILTGLLVAIVTIFKKTFSPVTAPLYALIEGFILGVISQIFENQYSGIVLQAVLLTTAIFVSMLLLYLFRIIRATENFKLSVAAATGGIALYYLANLVIGFFGKDLPLVNSNSLWGIGFTLLVIVIAALNLVVDFDFIEQGVEAKAPKYMEWYSSFGLFVTLVWLYLEILRLLAKARSR